MNTLVRFVIPEAVVVQLCSCACVADKFFVGFGNTGFEGQTLDLALTLCAAKCQQQVLTILWRLERTE